MANNNNNSKSLESWIWDDACAIRGAQDAPKNKDFILSLIFTKRLCDVFEELIRKFAELSNETAREHFTPREVICLMVNLLFITDREMLTKKGIVKTCNNPACGTGGMLSITEECVRELNDQAQMELFGQEINSYNCFVNIVF